MRAPSAVDVVLPALLGRRVADARCTLRRVPDYTTEELREQAGRAGRYFARALSAHEKNWVGVRFDDDTMILVSSGPLTDKLAGLVESSGLLGAGKKIERP